MEVHPQLSRLYYFLDPMCSWCWAFRPALRKIEAQLPENVELILMLGGLAADTDEPMPEAMRNKLQEIWRAIQLKVPGTEFNFRYWDVSTPRRSTYRACRAVIAAAQQGDYGPAMIEAIQRAYYLKARNPSDGSTLIQLARDLHLDADRFARDLDHPNTQAELERQITVTKAYGVKGFPTLMLETAQGRQFIDINPNDPEGILADIRSALG
ncbi:MAG: hypothetical protein RLZZ09_301 [Pseudomonadota bacterium]